MTSVAAACEAILDRLEGILQGDWRGPTDAGAVESLASAYAILSDARSIGELRRRELDDDDIDLGDDDDDEDEDEDEHEQDEDSGGPVHGEHELAILAASR